jgi:uncharacterized integral membrane protein
MVGFLRFIVKVLFTTIVVVFLAAAASFAVANRQPVTFSFWPLPYETLLPLGTTVLVALGIGLIVGTALMSLSRLRLLRRARISERRLAALEKENLKAATTHLPATHRSLSERQLPAVNGER